MTMGWLWNPANVLRVFYYVWPVGRGPAKIPPKFNVYPSNHVFLGFIASFEKHQNLRSPRAERSDPAQCAKTKLIYEAESF
jgi:hypothetical protein